MSTLPLDTQGYPIPALGYLDAGSQTVAITSTATRIANPFNPATRVVTFYATVPMTFRFGGSTISALATDHYFPAGVYYDIAIGPDTKDRYVAVLRAETDGTLYVSERQ